MSAKQKCFSHQFRFADLPALAVVGLLSAWAGPSQAALFAPSVEATMNGSSWDCGGFLCPTVISSPLGPIVTGASPTDGQSASVYTDYGTNGAAVSMWATRPFPPAPGTGHVGFISADSKWTDVLTVYTPSAAFMAPIDVVFSLRLHGHLEANRTSSVSTRGQVRFTMLLNEYGSWIARPSLWRDTWEGPGGSDKLHDRVDVDEIQYGRFQVPNGAAFNLISDLSTYVNGEFWGPYGQSFDVESAFANTVQWLGGNVWIGDSAISDFTITSGSGFDYRTPTPPTGVPEPAMLALLGIGLACLGALRRFT